MSNTSTIHIKTDFDCDVYDYDRRIGTALADIFFNVELSKGEHELTFVLKEDEGVFKTIDYVVDETDCDYKLSVELIDIICNLLDSIIEVFGDGLYIQARDLWTLQASLKGKNPVKNGRYPFSENGDIRSLLSVQN